MVPVFLTTDNPDISLRVVLLFATLCGLANALLLGRLASRIAGDMGALAASAMWSFSPVAIASSMDGLETSLALTMSLALTEFWLRARATGSTRHYIQSGIFAGLALLARVDTVFLVALLGLFELTRKHKKRVLAAAAAAAFVVSPWWIYSYAKFSTPVPESGAAVKMQVKLHQASYLTTPKQIAWATGTIIGAPFVDAKSLREWLFKYPVAGLILGVFLVILFFVAMIWIYKQNQGADPMLALVIHGVIIAFFYTFYLPALWFFRRYLHQTHAVVTLLLAIFAAELWRNRSRRRIAVPVLIAFAFFVALSFFQSSLFTWTNPSMTPDVSLHGAKGYREVSRDVFKILPEKAVLGALQSGALAFYGWNRFTVVNLDGVVDSEAERAIREHRVGEYAQSRGITYFADWPFNYKAFRYFGGIRVAQAEFRIIGEARLQGPDRTLVAQITWR